MAEFSYRFSYVLGLRRTVTPPENLGNIRMPDRAKILILVETIANPQPPHPLERVVDFDVGIAVAAVPYFSPLPKEGIGLIKEKDGLTQPGDIQQTIQVFFRPADVFADYS